MSPKKQGAAARTVVKKVAAKAPEPAKADAVCTANAAAAATKVLKHKRRFCREPGCTRIVKSQGLCQRHGAKPRKCKIESCTKQAQGNFDGMCKSHFKGLKRTGADLTLAVDSAATTTAGTVDASTTTSVAATDATATVKPTVQRPAPKKATRPPPPPPEGESVYDKILPASLAWGRRSKKADAGGDLMPLIAHLKAGFEADKPPAWHRNEERRARGLWPVQNPAQQLEGWERELVWMEILILTGNPDSSFRHLAKAWGRDKGFHTVLAQFICERHGDVQRKKRDRTDTNAALRRTRAANNELKGAVALIQQAQQAAAMASATLTGLDYNSMLSPSYPNQQQNIHGPNPFPMARQGINGVAGAYHPLPGQLPLDPVTANAAYHRFLQLQQGAQSQQPNVGDPHAVAQGKSDDTDELKISANVSGDAAGDGKAPDTEPLAADLSPDPHHGPQQRPVPGTDGNAPVAVAAVGVYSVRAPQDASPLIAHLRAHSSHTSTPLAVPSPYIPYVGHHLIPYPQSLSLQNYQQLQQSHQQNHSEGQQPQLAQDRPMQPVIELADSDSDSLGDDKDGNATDGLATAKDDDKPAKVTADQNSVVEAGNKDEDSTRSGHPLEVVDAPSKSEKEERDDDEDVPDTKLAPADCTAVEASADVGGDQDNQGLLI